MATRSSNNAGERRLPSSVYLGGDVERRGVPTGSGYATNTICYFLLFSDVGEAFALPDGCSAVLVGGTCGISGLIR